MSKFEYFGTILNDFKLDFFFCGSLVFSWQKKGGIYSAAKYPYLAKTVSCSYNMTDAIGFVDAPFVFANSFTPEFMK